MGLDCQRASPSINDRNLTGRYYLPQCLTIFVCCRYCWYISLTRKKNFDIEICAFRHFLNRIYYIFFLLNLYILKKIPFTLYCAIRQPLAAFDRYHNKILSQVLQNQTYFLFSEKNKTRGWNLKLCVYDW